MKRVLLPLLSLAILACVAPPCSLDASPEPEFALMPWHLVDVWWDIKKEVTIESYSIDVTVSDDVAKSEAKLFIAPFSSKINQQTTYGGLLTDLHGCTLRDPKPRAIGRGGTFRRWGKRGHDNIRPSVGGYFLDLDLEGDYVDVSAPYRWKKGKYTYKIVKMEVDRRPEGSNVWAGAYLYSHENDETLFIGALRFPGQALQLADQVCIFVELFDEPVRVRDIPELRITLGKPQVNGVPVSKPSIKAHYPPKVPACADVVRHGDEITIMIAPMERKRRAEWVELTENSGKSTEETTPKANEKPDKSEGIPMKLPPRRERGSAQR